MRTRAGTAFELIQTYTGKNVRRAWTQPPRLVKARPKIRRYSRG